MLGYAIREAICPMCKCKHDMKETRWEYCEKCKEIVRMIGSIEEPAGALTEAGKKHYDEQRITHYVISL